MRALTASSGTAHLKRSTSSSTHQTFTWDSPPHLQPSLHSRAELVNDGSQPAETRARKSHQRLTMVPFPSLPMSVLIASLLSSWIIEASLSSYAGFMVLHLGVVDDKNQVGEIMKKALTRSTNKRVETKRGRVSSLLPCFSLVF